MSLTGGWLIWWPMQANSKRYDMKDLKTFINNYDFTNPTWENLPVGFPNVSEKGLSKEETHLLEAIKMQRLKMPYRFASE